MSKIKLFSEGAYCVPSYLDQTVMALQYQPSLMTSLSIVVPYYGEGVAIVDELEDDEWVEGEAHIDTTA